MSTLREILQNYVQLPVPMDTILTSLTDLGMDQRDGTKAPLKPHKAPRYCAAL